MEGDAELDLFLASNPASKQAFDRRMREAEAKAAATAQAKVEVLFAPGAAEGGSVHFSRHQDGGRPGACARQDQAAGRQHGRTQAYASIMQPRGQE